MRNQFISSYLFSQVVACIFFQSFMHQLCGMQEYLSHTHALTRSHSLSLLSHTHTHTLYLSSLAHIHTLFFFLRFPLSIRSLAQNNNSTISLTSISNHTKRYFAFFPTNWIHLLAFQI